jgi:hypothetical protein
MTAAAIVLGSLILWAAVSSFPAVLLGKAVRLADERTPTAPTTAVKAGEASSRRRGAHLRLVR